MLVIGPNATFLRYISQVLPSLGETDVVLSSIAQLFGGVKAAPDDDPEAAVVKGDPKMVSVLRRAVRNLQRVPPGDLEVTADGVTMTVPRETLAARPRPGPRSCASRTTWPARCSLPSCSARSRRPRPRRSAASSTPRTSRTPGLGSGTSRQSRAALDVLWPFLTPQRLVAGLLARNVPSAARLLVFLTPNGPWCSAPVTPTRGRWRTFRCSTRPLSCSAPTTPRRRSPPGRRAGAPGRGEVRPGGARDHRPGRAGFRGRRNARRLEPRHGPAAYHGRTGLGRPVLGLRPRDRRRGAGAVRDGLADGDAPHPDPVADRGRRRRPAGERGRRPSWAEMLDPLRPRPLARGTADGQLPDPGRDHGGRRRRTGLGRPG